MQDVLELEVHRPSEEEAEEAEAERRNLAVPGAGSQVIKDCIERNKKKVNVPVATQANTPLQRRAST